MKSIVVLSGGIDSLACLRHAQLDGTEPHALFFHHSQNGELYERRAVDGICREMGVSLTAHAVYVPTMDSPLIHSIVHKKFSGGVSPAYRPGRNTIFLSIAVAIAEGLGAGSVYYGAIKDDQRVFPDCREEYVEAWNKIMQVGLANPVRVMAPLIQRRKREVVEFCFREKLPIHRTWSCYRPKEQHQCGTCDACEQRRKAFRDAGERDTTVYASVSEAKRAGISRKSDQ